MDKAKRMNKITAQEISEPPGPVGESSNLPGSTQRLSHDWGNNEGEVGPKALSRSEMATWKIDDEEDSSDNDTGEENWSPIRGTRGNVKSKIKSDIKIKGGKILSYLKKRMREEIDPFTPKRSLASSLIEKNNSKAAMNSEIECDTLGDCDCVT